MRVFYLGPGAKNIDDRKKHKRTLRRSSTMAGIDNFCPKIIMHRVFVRCNKMQKKTNFMVENDKNCHKKEIVC